MIHALELLVLWQVCCDGIDNKVIACMFNNRECLGLFHRDFRLATQTTRTLSQLVGLDNFTGRFWSLDLLAASEY